MAECATDAAAYVDDASASLKGLSSDDIAQLKNGRGWGLARPAELNGIPGPLHLLELKDEIPLSAAQVSAACAIYERMRADAVAEGERLIAGERTLEEAFRARTVTAESLAMMLAEIERSRAALRHIHLAAHLGTPALLTEEQVTRYRLLRGYESQTRATPHQGHPPKVRPDDAH